jgi:hypothetical protein
MLEADRTGALEHHRLRHFHLQVFAPLRQTDSHAMLLAGVRQDQRARDGLYRAGNRDARFAGLLIEFEFDGNELRGGTLEKVEARNSNQALPA